jgi:TonB family protein
MSLKLRLTLCICGIALGSQAAEWTPIRIVSVDYPLLAVQSRTSGVVAVECTLRQDGTVESARVESGSLLLGRAILERISEWKFMRNPAPQSAVAAGIVLSFEFKIRGTSSGPLTSVFVYDYPDHFTITAPSLPRTH